MSTFAQMLHIPRYLQQQIHQTLQLTHTPPSVPSLRPYSHLSEKHRGKPKTDVNENGLDQKQLFPHPPLELHFFPPTSLLVNNSTFLNTDSTKVG